MAEEVIVNADRRRSGKAGADTTREAWRSGFEAGESFGRRLRELETRGRERRLAELAMAADPGEPVRVEPSDTVDRRRLERRVAELSDYIQTLEESKPWRMIQLVRGWFGRDW